MIAADIQIRGMAELNMVMQKAALKLEHPKPMFARVAAYVYETFQTNMARGVDPTGQPLPAVSPWTRFVQPGGKSRQGRAIPLNNTGQLRNAMNIWGLSDLGATIGWRGMFLRIAQNMKTGKAGRMRISDRRIPKKYSGVRTGKETGRDYARIKMEQGWRTKRVFGNRIAIKPKARDFIYLTPNHIKKAGGIADNYVKSVLK